MGLESLVDEAEGVGEGRAGKPRVRMKLERGSVFV